MPDHLIAGAWEPGEGEPFSTFNPARPSSQVWSGRAASASQVVRAIEAARRALPVWSATTPQEREMVLRTFQHIVAQNVDELTTLIREETGKPTWDAKAEASLLAGKVDITLDPEGAKSRVTGREIDLAPERIGRTMFRPHGVMAVVGPFNFPMHLPNGHIVPALAMGNTIVFKPSDKAPACGRMLAEFFQLALQVCKMPEGVFNLVQGGAAVAGQLTSTDGVDGVLFTGSWTVGRRIMEANLDRPGRILALEMGGNNAAVVLEDADLRQAAVECVRSAFVSAGQRCTCTRRVIVQKSVAAEFIERMLKLTDALVIGDPAAEPPVFMGPMISGPARQAVLDAQDAFERAGATVVHRASALPREGWFISPGVLEVPAFTQGESGAGGDLEVFGPLVRVSTVSTLEEAIEQANATQFGLAASIFTRDQKSGEAFMRRTRAGCINWNTGTAGASSKLPFGGLGRSGNHRPAGAFSLDYCAHPVAGIIERGNNATLSPGMSE